VPPAANSLRPPRAILGTPPGQPAALAVVALHADAPHALAPILTRVLRLPALTPHSARLVTFRDAAGHPIDSGLACAWSDTRVDLFPHGGPLVVHHLLDALAEAGCAITAPSDTDPHDLFPEARSLLEARALRALASAASPRAVDLLLAQPRRWASLHPDADHSPGLLADHAALRHLLTPPLVAAVGAPNIGKSSLLNAVARRSVALVADTPGTTRDAVGCMLELDGLTVRYLDCPGFAHPPRDALDAAAQHAALALLARADLILLCHDAPAPAPEALASKLPPQVYAALPGCPTLRVALRSDLAPAGRASPDLLATSAATGTGLSDLAQAVRQALVPDSALADHRPWRFWS
jgi:tRNA modification GTPase